ncbi:hypothetical protein [Ferrimicrobium sp.]|uniref:hypothetical protein n=1 Tax=Ferrimicrobium sp. TaxID=2926050 RepID=UPI00262C2386|nr:hypothetical protein [Ferrimicrobium sp.]
MILTESTTQRPTEGPSTPLKQLVQDNQVVVRRVLGLMAAGALGWATFMAWNSIVTLPVVGFLAALAFLLLGAVALATLMVPARWLIVTETVILVLSCLVLIGWAVGTLYQNPSYGTDEAAFIQGAAQLAMAGHNPYTANLLPFLQVFRVPTQYATYLLNGGISKTLAYPSGSFLLVEPFILLTHGTQSVIIASLVCLLLAIVLAFVLLPPTWRMLGVGAIASSAILFAFSLSGLSVMACLPFLVVVASRWEAPALESRLSVRSVIQAVMLGIACAISQLAWFIALFLLVGLLRTALSHTSWRVSLVRVARYFGIAGVVFLALNAPWIMADPSAWLHGIFLPLTQKALPYGQGIIDLAIYFHIGGGSLSAFSDLGDIVILVLLSAYWLWFDMFPSAAWILPGVALWFPARSLAEYFTVLAPLWIVAYVSELGVSRERVALGSRGRRRRLLGSVLLVMPLLGVGYYALTRPAPLHMQLLSTESNGEFGGIWRMKLLVTNVSSTAVHRPEFSTDASGHASSYWIEDAGPQSLPAHSSAIFTLESPNVGSMPGIVEPFQIQVVSASPESVSESTSVTPEPYATYLSPSSVDQVLAPGAGVWLTVQLRSPYGARIKKAGVRVALGQVIYAQQGLELSDARINGAPYGQTPVFALTNSDGVARFHVQAPTQNAPIYFQSWVDQHHGYPFGYSETVSILWR